MSRLTPRFQCARGLGRQAGRGEAGVARVAGWGSARYLGTEMALQSLVLPYPEPRRLLGEALAALPAVRQHMWPSGQFFASC